MREFITAAEQAAKPDDDVTEFTVVEEQEGKPPVRVLCKAHKPGDGQLAVLMATTSEHSSTSEQIAGIINFFASVLDDDSHSYVVSRLLNRRDPFGVEQVRDIMEGLVEEWTGRPTQSPSGSTASPPSTGASSTPLTPALT